MNLQTTVCPFSNAHTQTHLHQQEDDEEVEDDIDNELPNDTKQSLVSCFVHAIQIAPSPYL
jgi:hypothetical protein